MVAASSSQSAGTCRWKVSFITVFGTMLSTLQTVTAHKVMGVNGSQCNVARSEPDRLRSAR